MSNLSVECRCGNTVQIATLNSDGDCPHCATCRVSSPPPAAKPPTNITSSAKKSFDTSRLHRKPIASKIPIATFLERQGLQNPTLPRPAPMPREAEGLSST